MGDTVNLPIALDSDLGHEFVLAMARYADGLETEASIKKKYRFNDSTWESLGENEALIEAIEAEKARRIRDGSTKRERAQQLVVKAPGVLSGIMLDERASPRHRVDAAKTLDAFAANGPETPAPGARFVITINLGEGHIEHYDKPLTIGPNDVNPDDINNNSMGAIAAIATKKGDGNGGQPI